MNFTDFWARLSPPEQKIIPKGFAEYIWNSAQGAAQADLAALEKKHFDNKTVVVRQTLGGGRQLELF